MKARDAFKGSAKIDYSCLKIEDLIDIRLINESIVIIVKFVCSPFPLVAMLEAL